MIEINLLPHRAIKREERRKLFFAICIVPLVAGVVICGFGYGFLERTLVSQKESNAYIRNENSRLDLEIKEIAKLREEIEALRARQKAVEDLQSDRNQPVHVLEDFVTGTPDGVYLKSLSQTGNRVTVTGLAANNAKVADYIRNLGNNTQWIGSPELGFIRQTTSGQGAQARSLYEFTLVASLKRPLPPGAKKT